MTSLSPGSERMSRHSVPGGDLPGLLDCLGTARVTRTSTCSQLGAVKQVRHAHNLWRRIWGTGSPTAALG